MSGRAAAALLLVLLAAGCGTKPAAAPGTGSPDGPDLPAGWRWEGFAGVEVGVPGDWGWGNSSQRLGQWCVDGHRNPIVGRPGPQTDVGCPSGGVADPSALMVNTGRVIGFDWARSDPDVHAQGDQESVRLGDVVVRVNAPPELRAQVLATVHRADVDAHGCAMHLPADFAPGDRPEPAHDLAALTSVTTVSACRYQIPHEGVPDDGNAPPLISSVRLTGDAASSDVAAIVDTPAGAGPDAPDSCLPEVSYGDEMIVLQVDSAEGRSTAYVYYSGCDHNGIDDGVTHRPLAAPWVRPVVAGANQPWGWSGPASKSAMLQPDPAG